MRRTRWLYRLSMTVPAAPTIICPTCPPDKPNIMAITMEATGIRCPVCRHRFRLITRQELSSRSTSLDRLRTRYEIVTSEGSDRTRLRRFVAPPSLTFTAAGWATLVYEGERLMGMAEQSSAVWYPAPAFAVGHTTLRRLITVLSAVCLLLAVLQLTRLAPALKNLGA